ncbi:hypothetical protein [Paenarthrobacter sp. YIM B13468]|uniref:DUF7507 domain-containing protein n=1 Tax=Paenarthrobacter sp. YIM B13468 TaxID=3366295 RepID=UPI00366B475F
MKNSLLARTFVILLSTLTAASALGGLQLSPAQATTPSMPPTPSTSWTPDATQPGTVVFSENFEHGSPNSALGAQSYSAPGSKQYVGKGGQTYTGSSGWVDAARCNGVILSYRNSNTPTWAQSGTAAEGKNNRCAEVAGIRSYQYMRMLALGMGQQFTPGSPSTNHVNSSYTECPSTTSSGSGCDFIPSGPTDGVMFKTAKPIPVTAGHYYTFGVNTAYMNCGVASGDPSYQFATVDSAGAVTRIGNPLNGCQTSDDPNVDSFQQQVTSDVGGTPGTVTRTVNINSMTSNTAIQATGNSLGLEMWNNNGATNGNDGAFDDVRLVDVTPGLRQSFTPAVVGPGGISTLTLTVTNTSELNAKHDWSINQVLPSGLRIARDPNIGGTCVQVPGTGPFLRSADAGSGTLSISGGDLRPGQASCTIVVDVTVSAEGTYSSASTDIATNLNPPAAASLVVRAPRITLGKALTTARAAVSDQFTMEIRAGSPTGAVVNAINHSTTAGSVAAIAAGTGDTGQTTADAGTTYYLTESGGIPSNYHRNITCTDAAGLQPNLPVGAAVDRPFALTPVAGADIKCILTGTAAPLPGLGFTHSADASAAHSPAQVGDVIRYSFRATNSGNVPLTDVLINNTLTGLPELAYSWPGIAGQLLPGQVLTATAAYTVTRADLDAGHVANSATLAGSPGMGRLVASLPVATDTPLSPDARLEFSTTVDASAVGDPAQVGEVITYLFTAKNAGNAALKDVAIEDPAPGLGPVVYVWPGVPGELLPGESVTASASYELTWWDVKAGNITNAATARGASSAGGLVKTHPATTAVAFPRTGQKEAEEAFLRIAPQSGQEASSRSVPNRPAPDQPSKSVTATNSSAGALANTGVAFSILPVAVIILSGLVLFLMGRRKGVRSQRQA